MAATCAAAASQTSVTSTDVKRDVAHGGETDRVEGRAHDRDPELVREKQERDQRPDEPGCEEKHALPEPALDR